LRERVLLILLGYAAAVLVASLVITGAIWFPSLWHDLARADLGFPFFVLRVSLVALTALSIIPAVLAVLFAERKGIRAARAYVAFGAAIGAIGLLVGAIFFTAPPGTGLAVALALVAAGALGGLTYWQIAGRTAGLSRPAKAQPAAEA
jgi:hypothetical protein